MMTHPQTYMGSDAFDCEYRLTDLLPQTILEAILSGAADLWPVAVAVVDDGGRVAYVAPAHEPARLPESLSFDPLPDRMQAIVAAVIGEATVVLPLTHELEIIGYLLLKPLPVVAGKENWAGTVGPYLQALCQAAISQEVQVLMTSRLHGETVEAGFRELQDKAHQLARSEKRYRELAESLEAEVVRQTREIQAAQAKLMQQEKLAAVGRLAAGMAHEINNPLGFMASNLNTLGEYCRDIKRLYEAVQTLDGCQARPVDSNAGPEKSRLFALTRLLGEIDFDFIVEDAPQLIEESHSGAARIQAIVANLKAFAQPGVRDAEMVDINHCLEITLGLLAVQVGEGTQVEKNFAALPRFEGRRSELNQAFMNILINARQAAGPNGHIAIRTVQAGKTLQIDISDDGPGIPPADRDRIFDPFFTTREVGQGCGLGLSVAQQVVRAHGGEVAVSDAPGGGTTVTIRLPRS